MQKFNLISEINTLSSNKKLAKTSKINLFTALTIWVQSIQKSEYIDAFNLVNIKVNKTNIYIQTFNLSNPVYVIVENNNNSREWNYFVNFQFLKSILKTIKTNKEVLKAIDKDWENIVFITNKNKYNTYFLKQDKDNVFSKDEQGFEERFKKWLEPMFSINTKEFVKWIDKVQHLIWTRKDLLSYMSIKVYDSNIKFVWTDLYKWWLYKTNIKKISEISSDNIEIEESVFKKVKNILSELNDINIYVSYSVKESILYITNNDKTLRIGIWLTWWWGNIVDKLETLLEVLDIAKNKNDVILIRWETIKDIKKTVSILFKNWNKKSTEELKISQDWTLKIWESIFNKNIKVLDKDNEIDIYIKFNIYNFSNIIKKLDDNEDVILFTKWKHIWFKNKTCNYITLMGIEKI